MNPMNPMASNVHSPGGSAEEVLTHRLGRLPVPADYAAHLGLPEAEVREAFAADDTFAPAGLDRPLSCGADTLSLADVLGTEDTRFEHLLDCEALRPLIAELEERDRRILHLRFYQEKTQKEIGEDIGCSQMHVSRLLTRILTHLHTGLTHHDPARVTSPAAA